jgi:3-hydroxybutyryl-CoA dehydrogenase
MSEINSPGVVGAGTMGHGIAQVAAPAGLDVVLVDVVPEAPGCGPAGRPGRGYV